MRKYDIIVNNDGSYDGEFYYGVKTTGIFCRPSCKSKVPLEKNVVFFDTKEDAINNGFRPCKRCRSDLDIYEPIKDVAQKVKELIEFDFRTTSKMRQKIKDLGLSSHRVTKIFKEEYGVTPNEYLSELRLNEIKRLLIESDDRVLDIAYQVGFNSLSPFYRLFNEYEGMSPVEYRDKHSGNQYYSKSTGLGIVRVDYKDDSVLGLTFASEEGGTPNPLTDEVFRQLDEYIAGLRKEFDFNYKLVGTEFQLKVWNALKTVGYGETVTYGEIAEQIGKPTASRAVGMALGNNPILIVVPCHRIIGANGKITGYAGGVEVKKKLLEIETK